MDNNTQLPVEVVNAVHMEAEEIYNKLDELARDQDSYDFGLPMFNKVKEPIEKALTAYATKLHQVEQENSDLRRQNDKLKEKATGWRPLLEKLLVMNEMWGDLPGEYINEVKKFLYGE